MHFQAVNFDRFLNDLWKVLGTPILSFFGFILTTWPLLISLADFGESASIQPLGVFSFIAENYAISIQTLFKDGEDVNSIWSVFSGFTAGAFIVLASFIFITDQLILLLGNGIHSILEFLRRKFHIIDFLVLSINIEKVVLKTGMIFKNSELARSLNSENYEEFLLFHHFKIDSRDNYSDYRNQRAALFDKKNYMKKLYDYGIAYTVISFLVLSNLIYYGSFSYLPLIMLSFSISLIIMASRLNFEVELATAILTLSAAQSLSKVADLNTDDSSAKS